MKVVLSGLVNLWNSYKSAVTDTFEESALLLNTGARKHTSLDMVKDRGIELSLGKALLKSYDEAHRYVIAKDVTFDLLLTAYDVNRGGVFAARIAKLLSKKERGLIERAIRGARGQNIELRLIGLQNGCKEPLEGIEFLRRLDCSLVEVDLFGVNTRHIVIDTKTGALYDLLLLNRIYRPGELAVQGSKEEFARDLTELALV